MSSLSYSRVSNKTSLSGFSLETQLAAQEEYRQQAGLKAWRRVKGNRGNGRFEDRAVSAWRKHLAQRPDGSRLVTAVEPGDDVIFYSLCRGFRSVSDWATTLRCWQEQDISMHFVKQRLNLRSPLGKFIGNLLASIAQFKCDMQSERSRMIKLEKKYDGENHTQPRVKTPYFTAEKSEPLARIEAAYQKMYGKQRQIPVMRPGTVYAYVRCSHQEQVDNDNSLPKQRHLTAQYAQRMIEQNPGLLLGTPFVDEAVSAWRMNLDSRPSGRLLCEALKPGDHVVVSRMDRAFRSVWDFVCQMQKWEAQHVTVHFVDSGVCTSDPLGKMMVTVAAAMSQYESDILSAVTQDGLAEYRAAGGAETIPRHLKWDRVGRHKKLEVNYEYIEEARWVRDRTREWRKLGFGRLLISDRIEEELARMAGKKPIPRGGIYLKRQFPDYNRGIIAVNGKHLVRRWLDRDLDDLDEHVQLIETEAAVFAGEEDPEVLVAMKMGDIGRKLCVWQTRRKRFAQQSQ